MNSKKIIAIILLLIFCWYISFLFQKRNSFFQKITIQDQIPTITITKDNQFDIYTNRRWTSLSQWDIWIWASPLTWNQRIKNQRKTNKMIIRNDNQLLRKTSKYGKLRNNEIWNAPLKRFSKLARCICSTYRKS